MTIHNAQLSPNQIRYLERLERTYRLLSAVLLAAILVGGLLWLLSDNVLAFVIATTGVCGLPVAGFMLLAIRKWPHKAYVWSTTAVDSDPWSDEE